jgi:hypothetical protein
VTDQFHQIAELRRILAAIQELVASAVLSTQTQRQVTNLRKLVELEISALEDAQQGQAKHKAANE